MKFFIDTANIADIKKGVEMGMVDGVTTNPSLVAKENRPFEEIILDICQVVDGPVSAEVISLDTDGMVQEARTLAAMHEKIVVKIPMTTDGIKAVKRLTAEGIKTNVTLVFSVTQALLAAKAGATFVSPFVGRLDDHGAIGVELLEEIRTLYDIHGFETRILAASLRHPAHVTAAALAGSDAATLPADTFKALIKHPLTDKGLDAFLADWGKTGQSIL